MEARRDLRKVSLVRSGREYSGSSRRFRRAPAMSHYSVHGLAVVVNRKISSTLL